MIGSRVRSTAAVATFVVLTTFGAACRSVSTGPSDYAPFSQTDLVVGDGDAAARGDIIIVNYTGWLYDHTKPDQKGAIFDSTFGRGPFSFTLGFGEVIQGWDDGLIGIQPGGIRRLVIPPSGAYGDTRAGIVPQNATLIFEIEMLPGQ